MPRTEHYYFSNIEDKRRSESLPQTFPYRSKCKINMGKYLEKVLSLLTLR